MEKIDTYFVVLGAIIVIFGGFTIFLVGENKIDNEEIKSGIESLDNNVNIEFQKIKYDLNRMIEIDENFLIRLNNLYEIDQNVFLALATLQEQRLCGVNTFVEGSAIENQAPRGYIYQCFTPIENN